ncbi:MAG: MFS transporter [Candidatus Sericytochromatia bacterium]|nr:MFS transporter [Candidatus Sericytochromatia bacterium]
MHPVKPGAPRPLVRAIVASAVGTAIEWYDFFLYGVAAALVFPRLFFPYSTDFVGQLQAFGTFFVGFLARPVGAAIFGHLGDRIGRKASLVATLLLMGVATVAIGLLPAHDQIGMWGAVALIVLRTLQGIGVGGEWGGSVLIALEWAAKDQRRGLVASWPQFGVPVGLLLANGALFLAQRLPEQDFLNWGWRLPFVFSGVLIALGLWIRTGVEETPVFTELKNSGAMARNPVVETLRHHGPEVLLTALVRTSQMTAFYLFTTFVLSYGTKVLQLPKDTLLLGVMLSAACSMITIPLSGWLSDVAGRRLLTVTGAALLALYGFVYFGTLGAGVGAGLILLVLALGNPVHDLQFGPQAALIAEAFPPRLRYSGSSLGFQLASVTAGGPAPLVATWLVEKTGSGLAVAWYLAACAGISILAVELLARRSRTAMGLDQA